MTKHKVHKVEEALREQGTTLDRTLQELLQTHCRVEFLLTDMARELTRRTGIPVGIHNIRAWLPEGRVDEK